MNGRSRFLITALLVAVVTSLARLAWLERQKRQLVLDYAQAQTTLKQLSAERAALDIELTGAKQTIDGQTRDLVGLHDQLRDVQAQLDRTLMEIAQLQRERDELREHNTSLNEQLGTVTTEKRQLESKLSDIHQLRLAIRDVKRKLSQQRWAAWTSRVETFRKSDEERTASGNHGLIIAHGQPTIGTSPRMHVRVLDPTAQ